LELKARAAAPGCGASSFWSRRARFRRTRSLWSRPCHQVVEDFRKAETDRDVTLIGQQAQHCSGEVFGEPDRFSRGHDLVSTTLPDGDASSVGQVEPPVVKARKVVVSNTGDAR
jgi:hypothetical protein